MESEERVCLRGLGDKRGIPKESLMIVGLVFRTRVPKIEQPYGTNTGQIRQMAPGRSMGLMGTGFQILASKGSGAAEDTDSSAYSVQVSVLNLGRRGEKPEFFVKGCGSQTKAHWNSREEQPLISDWSVCSGRSGYTTVVSCRERQGWQQPPAQLAKEPPKCSGRRTSWLAVLGAE